MEKRKLKIKTLFSGWCEVTEKQAREWAMHKYNTITTMNKKDKIKHINDKMQGITFEELERRIKK